MSDYTWTIDSVDTMTGTMVVAFTHSGSTLRYNIAIPGKDADLDVWVDQHAPRNEWARAASEDLMAVSVGTSGAGTIEELEVTETPNVTGTWNEEYLRAMIYSVLEEIRESEV